MEILGKPWNGVLLRALAQGPLRFSTLADRVAIGDRMLSCRLKELEAAGLLERTVEPGPPVRVSYSLTGLGRGLHEVTGALEDWGERLLEARGTRGADPTDSAVEPAEGLSALPSGIAARTG
jgi:DNA-binding HxlR family transcriptional regulator